MVTSLTSWLISSLFGKDCFDEILQDYAHGKTPLVLPDTLTPYLSSIIKRYALIAFKINTFFKMLKENTKQTPYSADELDKLWIEPGLN